MSEYWISQPRKFCEFCKCWIADNRPSKDFHEKGKRHQENVKKKIEDVKKKGTAKAAKDKEMVDSLREMEENALKAFKKDLMSNPALREQYGVKLKEEKKEEEIVYTVANRPEGFEDKVEETEESTETTATPTAGRWYTTQSPQGYTYYWNDLTGEVSWVPPAAYLAQQEEATKPVSQEPQAIQGASPENEKHKGDEPQAKKTRWDNPGSPCIQPAPSSKPQSPPTQLLPSEIPLPGDIPLPPDKTEEREEEPEEKEDPEEEEEEEEEEESTDSTDSTDMRETRRPKSHQSYGSWETVKEPEPVEVDFQLPTTAPAILPLEPILPTLEPKMKFREKKVTSLGSGPVFFKKRKKVMTAAQFLKKREESS